MLETPVLLLENFDEDSQMLYQSFRTSGFDGPVFTFSDEGFLPDDVTSIYTYYCGKKEGGKARYFNQIDVPDYWEIKASNSGGQVFDLNHERGKIFFASPLHKRLVKIVDWYDDTHVVRVSDHYNQDGFMYAKTIFNKKGQLVSRSYYDVSGNEKVVENFVTHDIILNQNDKVYIFKNKVEFAKHLFTVLDIYPTRLFYNSLSNPFFVSENLEDKEHSDVLFWQEGYREDIPGNMQVILDGHSRRTSKIYVQKKEAYEKLIELGANRDIEKLNELVVCMPNMKFHVCALTEMSQKLMSFEKYDNVHLYPGFKASEILNLFNTCDYFLDINYENEIVDATKEAFLHNLLILGFNQTIHNRKYVLPDFVFDANNYQDMIRVILDASHLDINLERQRNVAMTQNVQDYKNV